MISLFLFACIPKTISIGTIDRSEESICVVQLVDETFVEVESDLCASLKEGDIIEVVRYDPR